MAKLSKQRIQSIVKEKMPGFRVVEEAPEADDLQRAAPEAHTPDLETLRRKYLRNRSGAPTSDAEASNGPVRTTRGISRPAARDQIVLVEPDLPRGVRDRGPGPKAVIIDEDGEITAFQG